jgi:hypothetical protein
MSGIRGRVPRFCHLKWNLNSANDLATLTKILMVLRHRGFMLQISEGDRPSIDGARNLEGQGEGRVMPRTAAWIFTAEFGLD